MKNKKKEKQKKKRRKKIKQKEKQTDIISLCFWNLIIILELRMDVPVRACWYFVFIHFLIVATNMSTLKCVLVFFFFSPYV